MANKRSLNRVILIGTVGRDPEITHIPSLDKDVAKFSLVTNEVFMDRGTNQFQEMSEWHNIVAWGWTAKKVERNVKKGSLVLVEGKIKTRKWTDQNEQERRTTEIIADTITPLDRTGREESFGSQASGYGPPQQSMGDNNRYSPPPRQSSPQNSQIPPEMQIDDLNDFQYDDNSDPF